MTALHVPPATNHTLVSQVQAVNDVCLPAMAYPDAFYDQLRAGRSGAFVVKDHHTRVAGAVMYRRDGDGLYIQTLGVLPAYRRTNVATRLMKLVFDVAGGRRVALDVQVVNRKAP